MLYQTEFAVLQLVRGISDTTSPEWAAVRARTGPLMGFMAERLQVSPRTVQRVLARCRGKGLLKLERFGFDAHAQPWRLTPEGAEAIARAEEEGVQPDPKAGRPRGGSCGLQFTQLDRFVLWAVGTCGWIHVSSYMKSCHASVEGFNWSLRKLAKQGWVRKPPRDPKYIGWTYAYLTPEGRLKFQTEFPGQAIKGDAPNE